MPIDKLIFTKNILGALTVIKIFILNFDTGRNNEDKSAVMVEDGLTLGELLRRYRLCEHIAIVNKGFEYEDYILQDGDKIRIIVSGG